MQEESFVKFFGYIFEKFNYTHKYRSLKHLKADRFSTNFAVNVNFYCFRLADNDSVRVGWVMH